MDLVLTGTAAVSADGRRFGRSYQYFDIEWGLLAEIGIADDRTPVVVIAHDVQVIAGKVAAMPREAVADFVVTPTRLIRVTDRPRRPTGIHWDGIDLDELDLMPRPRRAAARPRFAPLTAWRSRSLSKKPALSAAARL